MISRPALSQTGSISDGTRKNGQKFLYPPANTSAWRLVDAKVVHGRNMIGQPRMI